MPTYKVILTDDNTHLLEMKTTSPIKEIYLLFTGVTNTIYFNYISAGSHFTISIDTNSKAWSWGSNEYQSLGTMKPSVSSTSSLKSVCGDHTFCRISSGFNFTVAVGTNGKAWGWGRGYQGQLGNNNTVVASTPVAVCGNHTFKEICVGYTHSIGIDNHDKLWAWGSNGVGQLGVYSTASSNTPKSVCGNHTFCKISVGRNHSVGIDNHGKSWSWGYNNKGELGHNDNVSFSTPISVYGTHTFCQISSGENFSVGIDNHGKAWAWGTNGFGQLGIYDTTILSKKTPVAVCGNHTFCKISTGQLDGSIGLNNIFCIALDYNNKAWGWGSNHYGQLGINNTTCYSTPIAIHGNHTFVNISCGWGHAIAVDNQTKIWSWGSNTNGEIGNLTTVSYSTPVAVYNIYNL